MHNSLVDRSGIGVGTKTYDFYNVINKNATYKLPVQHFPMADMITQAKVNLVFSEKPNITVQTGNIKRDAVLSDILSGIYADNGDSVLWNTAAEYKSYSGGVACKIVLDREYSETPIIVLYPAEDVILGYKYKRIDSITFLDTYCIDDTEYTLHSIYKSGSISYVLYKGTAKAANIVDLSTVPELSGLSDMVLYDASGDISKHMLAVYIPNNTGSYSDYAGCIDDFQALDEVYSNMMNYIRKSKVKTYFPENMCQKDDLGNSIIPNDYDSDNIILYDSNPNDLRQETKRDIVDIQNTINGYILTMKQIIENTAKTTGLSMTTLGYADGAGANASAEALNIRETVSMRTRSKLIHDWDAGIKELSTMLLYINDADINSSSITLDNIAIDNIGVDFAEYEKPTWDGIVQSLGEALDAKLIDRRTALEKLWGDDKTPEELDVMMELIDNEITVPKSLIDTAMMDAAMPTETEEEDKPEPEEE